MSNVVDLQKVRYYREQSRRLAEWVRRMLDQSIPEATPRTLHETNIICHKCSAPVIVMGGAYTCDECGHAKFIGLRTDDTIDMQ